MNTTENNKLIAKFMGAEFTTYTNKRYPNGIWRCSFTPKDNFSWSFPNELEYHSSWDWLMPVIRKCKEVFNKDDGLSGILYVEIFNHLDDVNIEATYKAVVEFIKWYNEQQK